MRKLFNQNELAEMYYRRVHPERKYTRAAAAAQWHHDKNIDWKVVDKIIVEEVSEQRKEFKLKQQK